MDELANRFKSELGRLDIEIERNRERIKDIQEDMDELNEKAMNLEKEILWYAAQKDAIKRYLKSIGIED
jgi:archaellum component FlaC